MNFTSKEFSYEVGEFSEESLCQIICDYNKSDETKTKEKLLFRYLCQYLNHGRIVPRDEESLPTGPGEFIKTYLIEPQYLSQSFLKDYKNYYSETFSRFEKATLRIHFFSSSFDQDYFVQYVLSQLEPSKIDEINNSYQGFIVIKPLPNASFGEIFLKTPVHLQSVVKCQAEKIIRLAGKNLTIKGLFFQEQNNDISVCATNALWSAFQQTALIFNSLCPEPSEITLLAGLDTTGNRQMPSSKGFTHLQISTAIHKVNLVPEMRVRTSKGGSINGTNSMELPGIKSYENQPSFTNGDSINVLQNGNLKRFMYAYLRIGIPVLYGFEMPKEDQKPDDEANLLNQHLVTAIGYVFGNQFFSKNQESDFISRADKIKSIIVHNDALGPYSEIFFHGVADEKLWQYMVSIEFPDGNPQKAYSRSVIVPVLPEIKINYDSISHAVREVDLILSNYSNPSKGIQSHSGNLIWDIYLQTKEGYLEEILKEKNLEPAKKLDILNRRYPSFIWIARAFDAQTDTDLSNPAFELLYDATDSPKGFCLLYVNYLQNQYRSFFTEAVEEFMKNTFPEIKDLGDGLYETLIISQKHLDFFKNH